MSAADFMATFQHLMEEMMGGMSIQARRLTQTLLLALSHTRHRVQRTTCVRNSVVCAVARPVCRTWCRG